MGTLRKIIFGDPDEMESIVSYQAMRITWIIINILFIIFAIWFFINGGANPISIDSLVVLWLIYFIVRFYLNWKMTRGVKDNE